MAADLHIHALVDPCTEEHIKGLNSTTWGSKHFGHKGMSFMDAVGVVAETPQIWIGEVSWLKAALTGDGEDYVPDPVGKIYELIGEELPVLDSTLKGKILDALQLDNKTGYGIADPDAVAKWLDDNMGRQLFTVSW